jgi:hypothetical protein
VRQHRTARKLAVVCCAVAWLFPALAGGSAGAVTSCSRTVIFTTPGVTWSEVSHVRPPGLLSLAKRGAIGSMSVHTDVPRPSYSSAFTTLGAGARMPSIDFPLTNVPATDPGGFSRDVRVTTRSRLDDLSAGNGYGARAGALADAMPTAVVAIGDASTTRASSQRFAQWPLLAAMGSSGRVQYASVGANLLRPVSGPINLEARTGAFVSAARRALSLRCATVVLDTGDLERALDAGSTSPAWGEALSNTDRVLTSISELLDLKRDLLLVVTPTSSLDVTHLGVAVAVGPGFPPGTVLESASTRRPGIVTLPDVAPTILARAGILQPSGMTGQPLFSVPAQGDRIAAASDLDREAVLVDGSKFIMSLVFLLAECALFGAAIAAVRLRSRRGPLSPSPLSHIVEIAALVVATLPVATFLARLFPVSELDRAGFIGLCLLLDAGVVVLVSRRWLSPLQRFGLVAALSLIVILADLMTGGHLQLDSLLGDSPLIAGRFAGAGNNAFAILAATAALCATLLVLQKGRTPATLIQVALLFAVVILVDGAPEFGSDVGGVLALVPGFAVMWMLLAGKSISPKVVVLGILAAIFCTSVFIAIDVARPTQQRTHLGRFFEDIRSRGGSAFVETVERKAASNLREARSLENLYLFLPPALVTFWFLFWPPEWWRRFGSEQPLLRAGCVGAVVVALLGSALNDSGITIFTTMLLFLGPMAILIRLFPETPHPPSL